MTKSTPVALEEVGANSHHILHLIKLTYLSGLMKSHYRSSTSLILLILLILSYAGNYFSIPIIFHLDWLFGSVFTMLVVRLYGWGWGTLAGAIAGASHFCRRARNGSFEAGGRRKEEEERNPKKCFYKYQMFPAIAITLGLEPKALENFSSD